MIHDSILRDMRSYSPMTSA